MRFHDETIGRPVAHPVETAEAKLMFHVGNEITPSAIYCLGSRGRTDAGSARREVTSDAFRHSRFAVARERARLAVRKASLVFEFRPCKTRNARQIKERSHEGTIDRSGVLYGGCPRMPELEFSRSKR